MGPQTLSDMFIVQGGSYGLNIGGAQVKIYGVLDLYDTQLLGVLNPPQLQHPP